MLGVVVRVWVKENSEDSTPRLVTVWAVYFTGLVYLGSSFHLQPHKESSLFTNNTLIFGMNWGFLPHASKSQLIYSPAQEIQENAGSKSYNVTSLCR